MKDFFVSYAHEDESWAEWIAWELDRVGYKALMQKWDFRPGSNFVSEMHEATKNCRKLILVLSENALRSKFVTSEWSSFFSQDPAGQERLLIPIRVDSTKPAGLLRQVVYVDLEGVNEEEARKKILERVGYSGARPDRTPVFPGIKESGAVVGPKYPLSPILQRTSNDLDNYLSTVQLPNLPSIRKRALGRAFVANHLKSLIKHFHEQNFEPAVITIDVDGMSGINKKFGVECGDMVIDRLFQYCESLKGRFVVGRLGDDMLFVILPNKSLDKAIQVARRLVNKVAATNWNDIAFDLFVHCSSGVAHFQTGEDAYHSVLRALEGQKEARKSGGNCAKLGPQNLPEPENPVIQERLAQLAGRLAWYET